MKHNFIWCTIIVTSIVIVHSGQLLSDAQRIISGGELVLMRTLKNTNVSVSSSINYTTEVLGMMLLVLLVLAMVFIVMLVYLVNHKDEAETNIMVDEIEVENLYNFVWKYMAWLLHFIIQIFRAWKTYFWKKDLILEGRLIFVS